MKTEGVLWIVKLLLHNDWSWIGNVVGDGALNLVQVATQLFSALL